MGIWSYGQCLGRYVIKCIKFLSMLKASWEELRSRLYSVLDRNYIERLLSTSYTKWFLWKIKKSVPLLITCPGQNTRARNSTNNNLEH